MKSVLAFCLLASVALSYESTYISAQETLNSIDQIFQEFVDQKQVLLKKAISDYTVVEAKAEEAAKKPASNDEIEAITKKFDKHIMNLQHLLEDAEAQEEVQEIENLIKQVQNDRDQKVQEAQKEKAQRESFNPALEQTKLLLEAFKQYEAEYLNAKEKILSTWKNSVWVAPINRYVDIEDITPAGLVSNMYMHVKSILEALDKLYEANSVMVGFYT